MCSEAIQLSVKPPAAANHENPDDSEKVESEKVEGTVVGEPDIKTNYQTKDIEIASKQTEISPREPDNTTNIEDEASDRNNTEYSKSDRTTDEEEPSNTNLQSSAIATVDIEEDEASCTDTLQHSQSSSAPKTVRQRIQESASVNSQVAISEDKTDSLYPLRTHFMQVMGSTSKDADVTTISEES